MQKENIQRRRILLIWNYGLIAILFLLLDGKAVSENELLLLILNTIFIGVIPIAVAAVAGYAYIYSKNLSILLMSCGMLVFGMGSILSGIVRQRPDAGNDAVAIYNLCMLFSAACQFGAAVKVIRRGICIWRNSHMLLLYAYGVALLFFIGVYASVESRLLPAFIDQSGGTKLRSVILWLSITGYITAFLELQGQYRQYKKVYLLWYAHSMLMIAVGLVIVFLSNGVGTLTGWIGRGTHYISAIFALHAMIGVSREVRYNGRPMPYVMDDFFVDDGTGYRNLAAGSSSAMFITDRLFNIRYVNESGAQMLGSSQEELMHKQFLDIFPDELKVKIRQAYDEYMSTGAEHGSASLKVSIVNKKGHVRPANMVTAYHTTYAGVVCTYILQDESEREHIFSEIERKNAALRTINQVCKIAIYGAEVNGFANRCLEIILKETDSCCGLIGVAGADRTLRVSAIKHSYHAGAAIHIGDAIPFPQGICAFLDFCSSVVNNRESAILHPPSANEMEDAEVTIYQKGVSYLSIPLITDEGVMCIISICSGKRRFLPEDLEMLEELIPAAYEMLQKEQAEAALRVSNSLVRAILDGTNDPVFLKDLDGRFQMGNKALCETLGVPEEELLGRTSLEVYSDKNKASAVMEHDRLVLQSGQAQTFEDVIPTAAGDRTYLSNKSLWVDEQGVVRGIIGISQDITERKDIELELKNQSLDLELKNKLITDFFINISHEFKTPLSVIVLIADMLEHEAGSQAAQMENVIRYVGILRVNAFRLRRLVSNLLDITKLDAGFMQPRWENVNVVSMLQNLVSSTAVFAKKKELSLRFNSTIGGLNTSTDSLMLERIVLNLLSNAIKHSKKGGAICVSLCIKEDKLNILVIDNGEGIPQDKQEIIFDRFRQVNTSLTRSNEGCGIGLSITKSLIELLGGTIGFESTLGRGSTFSVFLPITHYEGVAKVEQDGTELSSRIQLELSDISFE